MNPSTLPAPDRPLPRPRLFTLASTALSVGEARYARRLTLAWLGIYPGDLPVSALHARALLQEGLAAQCLQVLEVLCASDPEMLEAQALRLLALRSLAATGKGKDAQAASLALRPDASACLSALGGDSAAADSPPLWGLVLGQARQALERGELEGAERLVHQALLADPPTPLAAVTHLQILAAHSAGQANRWAIRHLAEGYLARWPTCLPIKLLLAQALLETNADDAAVEMLHQVAAADVTGQCARRLWGPDHPYRLLWPDSLEAPAEGSTPPQAIPIPAAVAAALGWNLLMAGEAGPESKEPLPAPTPQRPGREEASPQRKGRSSSAAQAVQAEMERIAARLKQPDLGRGDGRYPVYVIFTTRCGLETQYGRAATSELLAEMERLAETVRQRPGWEALLLIADETGNKTALAATPPSPHSPAAWGLPVAAHTDPWSLKRLLADLDPALARRGERIGALLIVGGPEVVPFHRLPNPVEDADAEVPSDNPYAARDENYFAPEWPVGRLPGGAGKDPQALLAMVRQASAYHRSANQRAGWLRQRWGRLVAHLKSWLKGQPPGSSPTLGYTAAVWRRASLAVFRSIGEPRALWVSPPLQAELLAPGMALRLGYYNLHGLADAGEWFGQRDPCEPGQAPDYPVALRPSDISGQGRAPQIVFSEACYGAHILERPVEQAMALQFLASGSRAVVGSTCISYGSLAAPLIAADLLGRAFWNALGEGVPAGEALRCARLALIQEMNRRQGYLDGEDQKTLISFILYGDPLAQADGTLPRPRVAAHLRVRPPTARTVCSPARVPGAKTEPSAEVLAQVRNAVAQYLPGMRDAHIRVNPVSPLPAGAKMNAAGQRTVTLSKQVPSPHGPHPHFACLTLSAEGKVVKLAVSR